MPAPKNVKAELPGEVPDTAESIAKKDETLNAQLEKTAQLVGSNEALNWGSLTGAAAVQKDYAPTGPVLPDQLDVDPDTIKAPVLTQQGWVLPTNDPRAREMGK